MIHIFEFIILLVDDGYEAFEFMIVMCASKGC